MQHRAAGVFCLQLFLALESLERVLREGYLIGLHTAGIAPRRLEQVLPLVDWVSMDVKSSWKDHARVTGVEGSERRAKASVEAILRSGVACEFHTVGRFDLD